jgi:hypothetical protein
MDALKPRLDPLHAQFTRRPIHAIHAAPFYVSALLLVLLVLVALISPRFRTPRIPLRYLR